MLVSPSVFHLIKTVSTWLKYGGMAFSTYLSIYELTHKTSRDSDRGPAKFLTEYGRQYRVLLIFSLVFTIGVSILENYADGKIEDEHRADFQKAVQKALDEHNAEIIRSFGPVVENQKKAIETNLQGLNSAVQAQTKTLAQDVKTTSTAIQKKIVSTSTDAQKKIVQNMTLSNHLVAHKLKDIGEAHEDVSDFFVEITLLDSLTKKPRGRGREVDLRLNAILKYLSNSYTILCSKGLLTENIGDMSTPCGFAWGQLKSWREAYSFLKLLDPIGHLEIEITVNLTNAIMKFNYRPKLKEGHFSPPAQIVILKPVVEGGWLLYSGKIDNQGVGGLSLFNSNKEMFKKSAWHREDVELSKFQIRVCDNEPGETDQTRKEHLLYFPQAGLWRISIFGSGKRMIQMGKESSPEQFSKSYDTRAEDIDNKVIDGCTTLTYSIY